MENFNFNTADSVIVKVIAYIKNNYSSDLKLEALGDMFNCNSAYLGKKFKRSLTQKTDTFVNKSAVFSPIPLILLISSLSDNN